MNGPNGPDGPSGAPGYFIPNNRAGRRAMSLKGKHYKKKQQEVIGYLVFSEIAPDKEADEAIYEQYRKEIKQMSTLEMLQTTNEHKANTYYEKGEETKPLTLRERYNATPAPEIKDPWEHIWNEHKKGVNA